MDVLVLYSTILKGVALLAREMQILPSEFGRDNYDSRFSSRKRQGLSSSAPNKTARAPCGQSGRSLQSLRGRTGYLGSWAEAMVVARLARNKIMNATRITTTPPTVIRSQKSDLSRMLLSLYREACLDHSPNFTAGAVVCSDHGRIPDLPHDYDVEIRAVALNCPLDHHFVY